MVTTYMVRTTDRIDLGVDAGAGARMTHILKEEEPNPTRTKAYINGSVVALAAMVRIIETRGTTAGEGEMMLETRLN